MKNTLRSHSASLTLGCSLTGTKILAVTLTGFSLYTSSSLFSLPGGRPPDCTRLISKNKKYVTICFEYPPISTIQNKKKLSKRL